MGLWDDDKEEHPGVTAAKVYRDTVRFQSEATKARARAEDRAARANQYHYRTARMNWLIPLLLTSGLTFLIVGPSVTIILKMISELNPVVWIVGILVVIFFWRRNIG